MAIPGVSPRIPRIIIAAVVSLITLTGLPSGVAAAEGAAAPQTPAAASAPAPAAPAGGTFGFLWVQIPGGEFTMGSETGEGDEKPAHAVRVDDFFLAKTPVTQAQWLTVMGTVQPAQQPNCDDCPVTNVSWDEAMVFLEKAGMLTGERLRLPTEAEWEYAAGGGPAHQTWAGTDSAAEALNFGWFNTNSSRRVQPVCKKSPNLYGLCDMSGNVWEWCSDWYARTYYGNSPQTNPAGPDTGENRVLRGGCYASRLETSRVSQRFSSWPGAQTPFNSLRPAKNK